MAELNNKIIQNMLSKSKYFFKFDSIIGNGSEGTVFKGINMLTKEIVAIKVIKRLDKEDQWLDEDKLF